MSRPSWRIDDEGGDPEAFGGSQPLLLTGRAMRDALARTWRAWMGAAILGGLLGVGALLAAPHPASASATLLMVHTEPGQSAMTTDVNLLQTRAVASRVVADLGLGVPPETFLSSVTAEPVNDQILSITVGGRTEAAAVARASSLVDNFLEFRAEQLRSIAEALIKGYERRITDLQVQADGLTREYARLSSQTSPDESRASEILTARANLGNEIAGLQSAVEDARLKTEAAITATHVIDAPEGNAVGSRRQVVLFGVSGAIFGTTLAIGLILFRTLTSDRLRQRREIAMALGVPVRVGVGPIPSRSLVGRCEAAVTSLVARLLHGHPVRWSDRHRQRNLEALVHGVEGGLPARVTGGRPARGSKGDHRPVGKRPGPTTLGLVAVDRTDAAAVVLYTAGTRMVERGVKVLLVDLSTSGALSRIASVLPRGTRDAVKTPRVFRPEGNPLLAYGPRRSSRRPAADRQDLGELGAAWGEADVVLALVEVDPGIDLDIVCTWVTRLVPLVSAGRASGELLNAIAGLVTAAGLEMPFALLEGADRSDQTLGHPSPTTEDRGRLPAVQSR